MRFRTLATAIFCLAFWQVQTSEAAAQPAYNAAEYDNNFAAIFAYGKIGDDEDPLLSVTQEQFADQISELADGGYEVRPIPEILAAIRSGKKLPPKTVGLTFDGADMTVASTAAPLLLKYKFPFTVFIPSALVDAGKSPVMDWDDLRELKKTGLVTFGLQPAANTRLAGSDPAAVKRAFNTTIADIRRELGVSASIAAYPFGEHDPEYAKILKTMGLKGAFAQQSGPAFQSSDMFALPRYVQNEQFGDKDRFILSANALPLPVRDITPPDTTLKQEKPAIGFTIPEDLSEVPERLSCMTTEGVRPKMDFLDGRIELRFGKVESDLLQISCLYPINADEQHRWRWMGLYYKFRESEQDIAPDQPLTED